MSGTTDTETAVVCLCNGSETTHANATEEKPHKSVVENHVQTTQKLGRCSPDLDDVRLASFERPLSPGRRIAHVSTGHRVSVPDIA